MIFSGIRCFDTYGQVIYHLDGPDAARHLSKFLELERLMEKIN